MFPPMQSARARGTGNGIARKKLCGAAVRHCHYHMEKGKESRERKRKKKSYYRAPKTWMQQRIHNTSWWFDQSVRCSYIRDSKKNLFGVVGDGGLLLPCASLFVRPTKERAHCALCSLLLVPSPCVRGQEYGALPPKLRCVWMRR